MDALEAKVKCLEFALVQAKNQGEHGNIDRVVEIQHRFYDVVAGNEVHEGNELEQAPETEPKPTRGRKPRADKSEIFS